MLNDSDERGDETLSGYFYFPCYPGDDGTRPSPSFVCSWRSTAILLNGAPHDGKQLSPNQPLDLSAVVTNSGALGAPALVSILYAPMSAQFTANLQIAVQFTDFWSAGETKTVGPLQWIVPQGIPSHVCLLAAVDSLLDPIPTPLPQSIADRHYAQCNLDFIETAPGSTVSVPILLGQSGTPASRMFARARVDLSVGASDFASSRLLHLDPELARAVSPVMESRTARARGPLLDLGDRNGDHGAELIVQIPRGTRSGSAVIVAVEQFAAGENDETPTLKGSLAVVIVAR